MKEENTMINLSEYIESFEDWELVEYASRYSSTRKSLLNAASEEVSEAIKKVWRKRYPGEPIPILGCVSPLHTIPKISDDHE